MALFQVTHDRLPHGGRVTTPSRDFTEVAFAAKAVALRVLFADFDAGGDWHIGWASQRLDELVKDLLVAILFEPHLNSVESAAFQYGALDHCRVFEQ